MKKLIVFLAFSVLVITTATFGEERLNGPINRVGPCNLVGTWTMRQQSVGVDGYTTEEVVFRVTDQAGNLFRGYSEPEDPPYTNFYGAIVGRLIYITCWDSITSGVLNRNCTRFHFVSQNQQYNPPSSPSTHIGIAIKD